jgi:hypothetical protein
MNNNIVNVILSDLQRQKHALIRQLDRKEISEEEYDKLMNPLNEKIEGEIKKILNKDNQITTSILTSLVIEPEQNQAIQPENKINEEESNMAEEKEVKKEKGDSYTQLIMKALMMKSLKTIEAVADKVLEWKPGRDIKNVKSQIHSIVGLVKKQDPKQAKRWLNYEWKEDEYLLVQKNPEQ